MTLAPGVEPLSAHLHGQTLDDVLAGRVEAPVQVPAPVLDVVAVDAELPGLDDGPAVPVRRYAPEAASSGPRPGVVWVHGGAWMFGDLDQPEADAVARRLCRTLDAIVWSVDYRLAPTHTFPAALDDVIAAFTAAAADPDVDPALLALGGASAGGNLAAGAAQALRDRGLPPAVVFLAYPATDPAGGPYPADRPEVCPPLLWFDEPTTNGAFSLYLGGATDPRYAVPAAGDLAGLPPTLVTTSTLDGLADQALRYVDLLTTAGVEVEHHAVDGLLHGYLNMCGTVDAADAALERHAAWLADRLGHEGVD